MTFWVMWTEIAITKASHSVASPNEKTLIDGNCGRFRGTAHCKRMNNAGARAECDRRLLKPALQRSAWFILHHTGSKRFRSQRKVITNPDRSADIFDVASERARSQIQCVVDQEPPRRHVGALPHIDGICEAQSIYKIILVAEEDRLDVGIDYFDMPNSNGHAGLVVLCDFSRELESSAQFKFCVTVESESECGKTSFEGKVRIKKKRIFVQDLSFVSSL